ncbi:hypothetical protein DID88_010354 [Monilinia fructigena]|uniref:Peptidase M3A/M3B catalytic domain-containing protein n=1 Tax=Monilinia fructigena TaxID=38457 RepID=A0A395ILW9_9HELO|nr:hypothetical protein DID88_010354 [Monilinia fructigena]
MAPSQYQKPPQSPPLFTHTESQIIDEAKGLMDKYRSLLDNLVATVKPEDATFENVLLPTANQDDLDSLQTSILTFYQAVSADSKLRDASSKAEEIMDEAQIEMAMREDVFQLVDAVYKKGENLDPESKRLLEKEYKGYIKNGLGIEKGPKRDRFKEISKRLATIGTKFQKNLNEEDGGIWFTLKGLDGFAKDAETRKQVFVQNENKCHENVELFKEAIILRDEAARLLGYPDHASFRIEDKMAKTPATVNEFLHDLKVQLAPGGVKEIDHLKSIKKQDLDARGLGSTNDNNYYLWDNRFYDRMMVENEFSIDENKIAEYFPLQSTIEGMLKIFEELFGFVFVDISSEEELAKISSTGKGSDVLPHPDFKLFSVWDDEGKYGHAANFNLQPGFSYPNGTRRYPATALVCNFSKPTDKKPSLLKHDEVVTLFHELGHGIHDLSGRTRYSRFHGTNTVRDFVEAPSQMLENWCWTPSQLKNLSKHYLTGEPIPDDLIAKQISTKHVNAALFNLRQLHFGIFDMTVHTPKTHEEAEAFKLSPEALGAKSDWGHGQATLGHLIGGYDAGYYGYLSSQVYSTDMFYTVFKKNPMDPKEGRRYRHMVLEKGGSQDEMTTLEQFLGRKPSTEAFYKELGLKDAKEELDGCLCCRMGWDGMRWGLVLGLWLWIGDWD